MSATVEVDRALQVTTIVTRQTLNATNRIAIMDKVGENLQDFEATNILLDVRELDPNELPGVKNLVVQLGLKRFKMFALVGGSAHDATLRRIVQWFPFGNTLNVFSTPADAQEWLAMQMSTQRNR